MEKRHHSNEEIEEILQELENGLTIDQVTYRYGISRATLYRWRKRARNSFDRDITRLRQADEENARLRNLLADAALEIHALKEKLDQIEK